MSDSPENFTSENIDFDVVHTGPVCHVAYTLNNDQPVLCSIISDQPMFYMDYEEDIEDEIYLNEEDIALLEKEVSQLKRNIRDFDTYSSMEMVSEERKFQDFLENAATINAKTNSKDEFSKASVKQAIVAILEKSRAGQAYLEHAAQYNVTIEISAQVQTAFYDRKAGQILINPYQDQVDMVLLAARELRRHWQHRSGALINPLIFQPDNAVLIHRLQVADLSTSMVRIAWELQLSGHKDIWERLEHSGMADLARAFAHEDFLDFRTINNGVACAAVLEAWFLSERCKSEDKSLIQRMLADTQGCVFDVDQPVKMVTAEFIAALGSMPFGKNYLASHTMTIMDDPIFNEVRDRSSANFLWFIKFERSFRETEQVLQNGESSFDQSPDQITGNSIGTNHEKPQSASVITFKAEQNNKSALTEQGLLSEDKGKKAHKKSRSAKADDDKIVYLRRWSADS